MSNLVYEQSVCLTMLLIHEATQVTEISRRTRLCVRDEMMKGDVSALLYNDGRNGAFEGSFRNVIFWPFRDASVFCIYF